MSKIVSFYFDFWGDFRVFLNYSLLFLITFVFFLHFQFFLSVTACQFLGSTLLAWRGVVWGEAQGELDLHMISIPMRKWYSSGPEVFSSIESNVTAQLAYSNGLHKFTWISQTASSLSLFSLLLFVHARPGWIKVYLMLVWGLEVSLCQLL